MHKLENVFIYCQYFKISAVPLRVNRNIIFSSAMKMSNLFKFLKENTIITGDCIENFKYIATLLTIDVRCVISILSVLKVHQVQRIG